MAPSTRASVNCRLVSLVGPGKNFLPSDVPTLRAVLQKGILIQEQNLIKQEKNRNQLSINDLCELLAYEVQDQWRKSNEQFIEPVTVSQKSLKNRLKTYWKNAVDVANECSSKVVKDNLLQKLDRLLDITSCRHQIVLCDSPDIKCTGCKFKSHVVNCNCKNKIPTLELNWLYFQRMKCSEKSQLQIASMDKVENKRQQKREARKQLEEQRVKKQKTSLDTTVRSQTIDSDR